MFFSSTRNNNLKVSSAQAIKQGLSSEGGLFVPECFPQIELSEIEKLKSKSYNDIAKFAEDYDDKKILADAERLYGN